MHQSSVRRGPARPRIARQVVHDRSGAVAGYEFLFAAGSVGPAAPLDDDVRAGQDATTTEMIVVAFGDFALHRLGPRRSLYVNPTRALLTGAVPVPLDPRRAVLEVLDPLVVDDELVDGVRELRTRGFRIAVNLYVGGPAYTDLLPLVDVVKLDVPTIGADLPALVEHVRATTPRALLLADSVRDEATLDLCRAVGADLFAGPHLDRRPPPRSARVKPTQLISLQLLAALADRHSTTDELERIVSADPGISLRVLQTVNSAAGTRHQVTTLRQAVVLVGRTTLSTWVMLAALGGSTTHDREDLVAILTRARTCELLAEHVPGVEALTAFAAGLISGLAEALGLDPHLVARDTRLDDVLTAAVVRRQGDVGLLLLAVEEYSRSGTSTSLVSTAVLSRAYLEGLAIAVETIDEALDGAAAESQGAGV